MPDRLMQIFAFAVLAGFLGVLLLHVPRLDLTVVILITLAAAAYDFFVAPDPGRGPNG